MFSETSYTICLFHFLSTSFTFLLTGQRETDKKRQFEIFYLNGDVVPNQKYIIEMNFTGPLTGDLAGLYLSQYKRGNDTM